VKFLLSEAIQARDSQGKVEAIKYVREATGCSLRSAVNFMESINVWGDHQPIEESDNVFDISRAKGIDINMIEDECIEMLRAKRSKVDAIKLVREHLDVSLRNAMLFVECLLCGQPTENKI
jgi:ribosomal protein L7/L12